MEAELEAAMAADRTGLESANAQEQMEAEPEAAMAAELSGPKYANAQEQMEAELEAAMLADAAAGVGQDVQHGSESVGQYPQQWQQKNGELDADVATSAGTTQSAAPRTSPLRDSLEGRAEQTLGLPGNGAGLDLDADSSNGRQRLEAVTQTVQIHQYSAMIQCSTTLLVPHVTNQLYRC